MTSSDILLSEDDSSVLLRCNKTFSAFLDFELSRQMKVVF